MAFMRRCVFSVRVTNSGTPCTHTPACQQSLYLGDANAEVGQGIAEAYSVRPVCLALEGAEPGEHTALTL